jgi:enamine deaminase RidA (YjgF/YER057c/UK114 family)
MDTDSVIERFHEREISTRMVRHASTLYIGGITATDKARSFDEQARNVLAQLDNYLSSVGADKQRLLFVTVFLSDLASHKPRFNEVWLEWLEAQPKPARTCVQATLDSVDTLVEINAIAVCTEN